jgi:RND family efflux transporter MFP subunit
MKKFFIILVVLAGLSFLGWQVYQKITAGQKSTRPNHRKTTVAVEITPIKKDIIRDVRDFTGSLYPASEIVVAPKIAGRMEKILVRIGDRVKNGQLVATIDDDEYRQQVMQAQADLEVAQANLQEQRNPLENAKKEYERIASLYEKKIVSESAFDRAVSELRTQEAKLNVSSAMVFQKDAALETAKVRLAYTQIQLATDNGNGYRVVGERFVDEGAMLAANTPIVSVLDIEKLIAVINVIERDYPHIRPGMKATVFTDAYPDRVFSGEVIRIAPMLKEKSREARVELEIVNHDRALKPGMFIRAQIQFDEHKNATLIPVSAIVKRDGLQGVFLADLVEKKARFVQVKLGIVNGHTAEVLDPPLSGSVVVLGQHLLEDGVSIFLPQQTPSGEDRQKMGRPQGNLG